jgi:cold shock CspA family protein
MPLGKLKKLVHLSQQKTVDNTRLVPSHNDKGYGILVGIDGREVYFSHEAVRSRFGFDDLRIGQTVEYELEIATYLRASSVTIASPARSNAEKLAA